MITKPAFLILGMINEGPKGAYEINKILGQMNLKWWLTISSSAVYVTMRNLEKKKYVTGYAERNGNMPERTVYTITEYGKKLLLDTIREAFCTMDFDTTCYSIAMIYMYALEKDELKELISRRSTLLQEYIKGIDANIFAIEPHVKHHIVMDIERMKYIIEAELKSLASLSAELQSE